MFPALRLRRDIVCQQAVELVTGYLEGTLVRAGHRRFEAHLAGCPHCTRYLAQMRKTIELTGSLTPGDLTRGCRTSSSRSTGNGAPARTASQLAREPGGGARRQAGRAGVRDWSERGPAGGQRSLKIIPGQGVLGWRPLKDPLARRALTFSAGRRGSWTSSLDRGP